MVRRMRSQYVLDRSGEPGASMDVARRKIIAPPPVRRRNQATQPSTSHAVGCNIPVKNPILSLSADLKV